MKTFKLHWRAEIIQAIDLEDAKSQFNSHINAHELPDESLYIELEDSYEVKLKIGSRLHKMIKK